MRLQPPFQRADALRHRSQVLANCRLAAASLRLHSFATRISVREPITEAGGAAAEGKTSASTAFGAVAAATEADTRAALDVNPPHILTQWITNNGGYVHPALEIVDNAPCGCRGVIATEDIAMQYSLDQQQQPQQQQRRRRHSEQDLQLQQQQQQQQQPIGLAIHAAAAETGEFLLIAVPEQLYMTAADALSILGAEICCEQQSQQHQRQQQKDSCNGNANTAASVSHTKSQWGFVGQLIQSLNPLQVLHGQQQQQQLAQSLGKLQPALLLALLLAFERRKGAASFWYPYISSLPEEPPCGWLPALKSQQQQQQQQQQGEVAAAAAAVLAKCTAAATMYGPALGGCITVDDVIWAYGQVISRAFGFGPNIGLAPLIDMCNHAADSTTPQLLTVPLPAAAAAAEAGQMPVAAAAAATNLWHGTTATTADEQQQLLLLNNFWCVCKAPNQSVHHHQQQQQQQLVLAAGEELYISYMANSDASACWLNFGFVPPERS